MNVIEELKGAHVVGITGHIRPDGDCTGSTLALYNYLKKNMPDMDVSVYLEQPGEEFSYLSGYSDIKNTLEEDKKFDVFIVLDCSSIDRIEPFARGFENADKTICIDHHISNNSFADVNQVVPDASSACEVLYDTLDDEKIDKAVAECIYTGIIHDTGVFKYSCTSLHTMEIAGKMMQMGIDYSDIIDNSFYLTGRLDEKRTGNGTKKRASLDELTKNLDPSMPLFVISHEPDHLSDYNAHGVDIVLSGHTHAGQFFPLTIVQPFVWENYWGMKMIDLSLIHISEPTRH